MFIIFRFDGGWTRASKQNIFVYTKKTRIYRLYLSLHWTLMTRGLTAALGPRIRDRGDSWFSKQAREREPFDAAPRKCVCVLNQHLYELDVSPKSDLLRWFIAFVPPEPICLRRVPQPPRRSLWRPLNSESEIFSRGTRARRGIEKPPWIPFHRKIQHCVARLRIEVINSAVFSSLEELNFYSFINASN